MKTERRILVTAPYDLSVPGGVNAQAIGLWRELNETPGYRALLLGSASGSHGFEAEDPATFILTGSITNLSFNGARTRCSLDPSVYGVIRRAMERFRPDLVHLHEPFVPLLNYAVLRYRRCPVVGTFHTYSETSRGYFWAFPVFSRIFCKLDRVTAVSPAARAFANEFYPGDYQIIPNAVKMPAGLAPSRKEPGSGPLQVLFLGRWDEPRKGFPLLLKAMQVVEARTPGAARLVLAGPGSPPESGSLPIDWRGCPDDAGRSALLTEADLVALPSRGGESFGLVALEAMAHGTPVLAFSIRGYRDWMERCPGAFLVHSVTAEALGEKLTELTESRSLLNSLDTRCRAWASAYHWEAVLPLWKRLYSELAG